MFWEVIWVKCLAENPFKHPSLLNSFWGKMKDAAGRENFAVIHSLEENIKKKNKALSSHSDFRVRSTGQHSQVRVCSSVWSFHAVLANPGKTQRHPHHVGASVFERKERTYLWSRQRSPENRFSSLFLINLWTKTRDSDTLQRKLRKIYNPSGRSLSSISHEDLAVFSCEAGVGVLFLHCSSDHRRLGFCAGLWECGSRRHGVDTENKVGLDRLKVCTMKGLYGALPTVAVVLIGWNWTAVREMVLVTSPWKKQIKVFIILPVKV